MTITANTSLRRKLAALFCVPSAATLAAASGFAVVLVNGPMVQPANAEAVADTQAVWEAKELGTRDGGG